ncbi:putative 3'-5' exonuclease related to the exonuclease domain of PolB [Planctomycetes bacterium Pan216]|uniref:Putative 3'-5' exonuclease related to the exonuclease domain of PolB n=1 Tax=Kolteria novifilia TaxID=2527975 RepID=A0A518B549_9BACT|nr:putative 3'-5' exonuclease related to the exonuclease domain of PolB [Planctomycetes bacterium Pan216]
MSRDEPAYLVFDVETVPDGELLRRVRYPREDLSPDEAVDQAQREALERSGGRSDFVPITFCYPVAICVARVTASYELQAITLLDDPRFSPQVLVQDFWRGLSAHQSTLVSFNGRGFDLPVLEMAAFRYGVSAPGHFSDRYGRRYRYGTAHLDLCDWLSNHGATHVTGGLNLLSKLLGKPGKMDVTGSDVLHLFREGRLRDINDYCMFDVLDTYFVFLRTRVMTGAIDLDEEQRLMTSAHRWIESQLERHPHLGQYLENWGDWKPWP